jgi:hypothetical protein
MFKNFNLDKTVMASLGAGILLSLLLAITCSLNWLWLTAFIGVHQIQMSFTHYCLLARYMKKCGVKPGKIFE